MYLTQSIFFYLQTNWWSDKLCKNCKNEFIDLERSKCYKCNSTNLEKYMRPIEVEFKFMDSLEFIGTTLEKAIKNLLNINSSYCNHCKKVRELKDPSFKVIGDHIYAYDICNFCKKFEMKKQINTDHMKHFNHVFKDVSLEEKCFLLRKGVYPYEFIDDINKLLNKELPEYKDFHSKLSGKCSEKDYEFAKKLWNYYKNNIVFKIRCSFIIRCVR